MSLDGLNYNCFRNRGCGFKEPFSCGARLARTLGPPALWLTMRLCIYGHWSLSLAARVQIGVDLRLEVFVFFVKEDGDQAQDKANGGEPDEIEFDGFQ